MALGSVTELQNQILIARDIRYINQDEFQPMAEQSIIVNKLINGLNKKTKTMIHNS